MLGWDDSTESTNLFYFYLGEIFLSGKPEAIAKIVYDTKNKGQSCSLDEAKTLETMALKYSLIPPNRENLYDLYESVLDDLCAEAPLFPKKIKYESRCEIKDFGIERAREILSQGSPFSVNFCSKSLNDPDFKLGDPPNWEECGHHASVILGTARDSKGRCSFVLRNSWVIS